MSNGLVVPAPSVTWRVVPVRTPHVIRACPRCAAPRSFGSSDRFRVNASGRRLDVWLIYRCAICDFTWNLTVWERTAPKAIGAARLEAFLQNDPAAAWSCAFDGTLLRRAGARVERSTPVRVERCPLPEGRTTVRFELPFAVQIRLDRLLAQELEIPRSRLSCLVATARALRRPVFDGQVIELSSPRGSPSREHEG